MTLHLLSLDGGYIHGSAGLATNFMWHCMGESFVATSLKWLGHTIICGCHLSLVHEVLAHESSL